MPRKGDIPLSSRLAKYASSDSDSDNEKEEEVLPVISDSSDEEDERQLRMYQKQLQNLRRQGLVKGLAASDSEQDSDEAEEEEDEEAGLPSRFYWGDKKSVYYGADVRDGKIDLGNEDRLGDAALEEKEGLLLQKRQFERLRGAFAAPESSKGISNKGKNTKKEEEKETGKKKKGEKAKDKKKEKIEEKEKTGEKKMEKEKGKKKAQKQREKTEEEEKSEEEEKTEKKKSKKEKKGKDQKNAGEKKIQKQREKTEEEEKSEEEEKTEKKKSKKEKKGKDKKNAGEKKIDPEYEKFKEKYPLAEPLYNSMVPIDDEAQRVGRVYEAVRDGDSSVVWAPALRYLEKKFKLGTSISMYTLLYVDMVMDDFPVENHPIMEDILRYRKAWKALETLDKIFAKSVDNSIRQLENGECVTFGLDVLREKRLKQKRLSKQSNTSKRKAEVQSPDAEQAETSSPQKAKKAKTDREELPPWEQSRLQDSDEDTSGDEVAEEEEEEEGGRGATKEMEKNEGLKPYKKRKQKHARTKHREKYRKAVIRRKGQVRTYKPELEKYRGEPSGIRAGVIRSRRLR